MLQMDAMDALLNMISSKIMVILVEWVIYLHNLGDSPC